MVWCGESRPKCGWVARQAAMIMPRGCKPEAIRAASCRRFLAGGRQLSGRTKLKYTLSAAERKRRMQSVFLAGQNRPPAK